jgi:Flp pilus assembly protein TadD
MRTISKLSLAVLALVVSGAAVQAQTSNNASVTATATVQTPINVVAAQQLNFSTVFPGVNKAMSPGDLVNAGRFDVSGQPGTAVTLSFTLPASLSDGGVNSMPIDSYNAIRADNLAQASGTLFSPGPSNAAALSGTGALYVWVGARVVPATTQVAGVYTGSIIMTVVY